MKKVSFNLVKFKISIGIRHLFRYLRYLIVFQTINPIPTISRRDIVRLNSNDSDEYDRYNTDTDEEIEDYGGGDRSVRHRIMEMYTDELQSVPQ